MPVRPRPAGRSDLDRIDRIEAASFAADRCSRRNLRRMLEAGRTRFLLADAETGAGGYLALSLRAGSGVARVYSLAVAPDSRRQGVGEALIDAAARLARQAGCDRLRLEVRASNKAAIKLYERRGFRLHDRRNDYYEDGETALVLQASVDGYLHDHPAEQDPS